MAFMEMELFVQNKQEAPRCLQSSKQNAGSGMGAVGGMAITAHPLPRLEPAPGREQVGQWLEQVEWDLTSPPGGLSTIRAAGLHPSGSLWTSLGLAAHGHSLEGGWLMPDQWVLHLT